MDYPKGLWPQIFLLSSYLGQMWLLSFITCFTIPVIAAFFLKKRFYIPITIFISSLAVILLLVDTVVFTQYSFHINGVIINMIFSGAATEIFQFSPLVWAIFISIIAFVIATEIAFHFLSSRYNNLIKPSISILFTTSMIGTYIFSLCVNAWFNALEYTPIITYNNITPLYCDATAKSFLLKHHFIYQKDIQKYHQLNHFKKTDNKRIAYPLHKLVSTPLTPFNIMLIVVDTWRADTMNASTTPNIYKFSQNAAVFNNHSSGGDCTEPGIFSLFYGIPSTYWDIIRKLHRQPVLLNFILKNNYKTAIFGSAPLTTPPFDATVFANIKHLPLYTKGNSPWQRDITINNNMLAFLRKQRISKRPFFGFLFYDAVHGFSVPPTFKKTYTPTKIFNYFSLNNNTNPTPYFNLYKNAVLFDDQLIGKILTALKNYHFLKNTVVIITADHGEEFNEEHKNHWGHASDFSKYQIKTPLIVYWPGKTPATYNYATSHYDIAPTLLEDIFHIHNPTKDYSTGVNLFKSTGRDNFFIVHSYQYSGIIGKHYIITYLHNGSFTTTDQRLNPIPQSKVPNKTLEQAWEEMTRYHN